MSGETTGAVRVVLRFDGLLVLIAACIAYAKFGLGWGTFALVSGGRSLVFWLPRRPAGWLHSLQFGALIHRSYLLRKRWPAFFGAEAMSSSSGFDYTLDRIKRLERKPGQLKRNYGKSAIRASRFPQQLNALGRHLD